MEFDSVDMNHMWLNVHVDSLVIFVGTLYLAILATNKHHATQQVSVIHKNPVIRSPRAGSGVVRMDPLHFLAGCHTRRQNQV